MSRLLTVPNSLRATLFLLDLFGFIAVLDKLEAELSASEALRRKVDGRLTAALKRVSRDLLCRVRTPEVPTVS